MTTTTVEESSYGADEIVALEGLEAVRKRPGMYVGSTGKQGYHHLLWEIVDNSVDEAMAGSATRVDVVLHKDGSASVKDNGRGIPVAPQTRGQYKGMPTVEMAMTILHAGGKFGGGAYTYSGGLHGVGTSVVNALSSWMNVEVCRDGKKYGINFHSIEENVDGIEKVVAGKVKDPLHIISENEKSTGTSVRFIPDPEIFSTNKWDVDVISRRLRNTALLNSGFTCTLEYQDISGETQKAEWHYPNGLVDFMGLISSDRIQRYTESVGKSAEDEDAPKPILPSPLLLSGVEDGSGEWQACLQWFPDHTYTIDSFVNGIETSDGGTHVDGFQLSLNQLINKYCRQDHIALLGDKDPNLDSVDIRSGLGAIITTKVPEPQFMGQTKTRLGNDSVKKMVRNGIYNQMWEWMEEHPAEIGLVLTKCINEMRLRLKLADAAERERSASEKVGVEPRSQKVPTKLSDCDTKDRSEAEMFIVEGDSAGGGAVLSRNPRKQAILPIRGKIYNVNGPNYDRNGMDYARISGNEEVQSIINAIGTGSEDFCDISQSRYGKVIILCDADDDGRHIQLLLMTLFYRLLRPIVTAGMLYVSRTPLYGANTKGGKIYAYDNTEREELDKQYKNLNWTRFKGLGEMDADVLGEMALNPRSRKIVQITVEDLEATSAIVNNLMGGDSSFKWEALSAVEINDEEITSLT